ncbi:MAG: NTP transferase domain-containing protein [Kiritimatiellae bacterium]|nr:NTP transferase domain-containing protein [Kiritimatiellia bacterium]
MFWNENALVHAFLSFNSSFSITLSTAYLHAEHPDTLKRCIPAYDTNRHFPVFVMVNENLMTHTPMQVVILAGGLGTRIRSLSEGKPKSLIQVAGRPFIKHQLELLVQHKLTRILLCVGYLGEHIEAYVGDGSKFGMKVSYAYEDPDQLRGTGGALVQALPLLEESFLVLYGDSYLPMDYQAFIQAFRKDTNPALMSVYKNNGKWWDTSNVSIIGQRIAAYSKKGGLKESDYIDYGLSAYDRPIIEQYKDNPPPLDLAHIQKTLVSQKQLGAFIVQERFYEVGKPKGIKELERYLQKEDEDPS